MSTLYTQQDKNRSRTWLLMMAFFVLVGAIGWGLSYYFQDANIFYIAIIFSALMNVGAYWWSDKLVLKMAHAKPVTREQAPELWNIVENLAITAGLPMPRVYIMNESAPNAFATGRDPKHSVLAVTTGLLQILDKNELEGVIAHELAHIGNRDMLVGTVAVVLAGFVSIVADIFLRSQLFGRSSDSNRSGGILIIIGLAFAILAPLFATLLRLAVSRKREYLADASGALLTRYPEGLASALQKISANSRPMQHAHQASAHLFISNPFGSAKKFRTLFSTHPPVEKRIAALRGI